MNILTDKKMWLSQAASIIPRNEPMVFWDTCALLDVLRIPLLTRPQFTINTLQAYEQLEAWIQGNRITSVTSELVIREFSEHADHRIDDLAIQEQKTKNEVKEQTQYMSDTQKAAMLAARINNLDIQRRVVKLVTKIWRKTKVLKCENSFAFNADYRVRNYLKPSGGKESYKDCYLWISYISLLNEVNPTEPAFFFTTNPVDFAENKSSVNLHPDLKAQLPLANAEAIMKMEILSGKLTRYFAAHP